MAVDCPYAFRFDIALRDTPKTLPFALLNGIVEFDGCPPLSEGEQVMMQANACVAPPLLKREVFVRARGEQGEKMDSVISA